jgi:hypothetical protein
MPLRRFFQPAQVGFDLGSSLMMGRADKRSFPEHILDIDARVAFDEQTDQFQIACERCLVKGWAMGVPANGVEALGVFPGLQQEANDRNRPPLRNRARAGCR